MWVGGCGGACGVGGGGGVGSDVRLDECVCPYPSVDAPNSGCHVPVDMALPRPWCARPQKIPTSAHHDPVDE